LKVSGNKSGAEVGGDLEATYTLAFIQNQETSSSTFDHIYNQVMNVHPDEELPSTVNGTLSL
jgi:hypothetical protein